MTKFILHGGVTSGKSIYNKRFFKEIYKSIKGEVKILLLYFASNKNWKELFNNDKTNFLIPPNKSLKLFLASKNPSIFKKQINSVNAVYIRGGDNILLKKRLSKVGNLSKLFNNKVIVGSSAGANILAKYYYSTDKDRIEKGFGLLPIKVFCHYSTKKISVLKELKEYGENLKIYKIPETKYFIINNNI
jgi:peptidase E